MKKGNMKEEKCMVYEKECVSRDVKSKILVSSRSSQRRRPFNYCFVFLLASKIF